jgi:hypothetical protein
MIGRYVSGVALSDPRHDSTVEVDHQEQITPRNEVTLIGPAALSKLAAATCTLGRRRHARPASTVLARQIRQWPEHALARLHPRLPAGERDPEPTKQLGEPHRRQLAASIIDKQPPRTYSFGPQPRMITRRPSS